MGQSITLSHISPFVDVSRKKYIKEVKEDCKENGIELTKEQLNNIVERKVKKEIKDGIQTLQYQFLTLSTTNGQAPFITVFCYLDEVPDGQPRKDLAMCIEEMIKQRIESVKNPQGVNVTTAFPKIIYVLDEDNIHEDSEYYWLTKLCAECTSKRLVPDYVSAKIMKKNKEGNVFPPMGCRSLLSPWKDETGKYKFYGRPNQGVITLSLPDIALSSKKDMDKFWKIFDERLELCHRALRVRHESLLGVKSDVAPILWQHGAYARLKPGETIDKLLFGNYSTISLGYSGLYECVKYMTGKDQITGDGHEFALDVMKKLNEACEKWKEKENIGYSVYGSPMWIQWGLVA